MLTRLLNKLNVFIITNVVLVVFGFAFILFLDYKTKKNVINEFEEEIYLELEQRSAELGIYLDSTRNAVDFLHATPPIAAIVRSLQNDGFDPIDQTPIEAWYARIETIFEAYLENKQHISQARIIRFDELGQELVRVQQSKGKVRIIQRSRLQQKADREYFSRAKNLNPDEVYISPINLNREWGKIEFPYRPTYRVVRNIYDDHNRAFGFIIINVNPLDLLTTLHSNLDEKYQFYLVNSEGGAIIHADPKLAFAFEFDENANWMSGEIRQGGRFFRNFKYVSSHSSPMYFKQKELLISPIDNHKFRLIIGFTEEVFMAEVNSRRTFTVLVVLGLLVLFMLVTSVLYRTYKKQTELSKKEAEYQAIFDGSNDAVIGMDKDGRVINWNHAAELMFGYPPAVAMGKSVFDLILHDDTNRFSIDILMKVFEGESVKPTDISAKNIRGERLDVSITLSPIVIGNSGVIEGASCILRDVTEQKIVEKQILQLNTSLENQVKARTAELEQARNEALEVSKVKSEFVASVSHEIRTPMNGVIGMLHMLAKTPLNELQNRYLSMAHNSAKALTTLINDILDLSKIEAGKLELDEKKFDVFELFGETCSSLALAAQDKGLKLSLDTSGVEYSYLISDDTRIRQVLINLINNATKFTSRGGIFVRVHTEDAEDGNSILHFQVKDTGVGIAKDKQAKLFQSFSQEDSSTSRKYGGTGLGLAICKKLAELLGGGIELHSESGKGSTFKFTVKAKVASEKLSFSQLQHSLEASKIIVAIKEKAIEPPVLAVLDKFSKNYEIKQSLKSLERFSSSQGNALTEHSIIITDASENEIVDIQSRLNCKVLRLTEGVQNVRASKLLCVSVPFTSRDFVYQLCELQGLELGSLQIFSELHSSPNAELKAIIEQYSESSLLLVDDNEINLEVAKGMLAEYGLNADTAANGEEAIQKLKIKAYELVFMDCQMPIVDGFETTRRIRAGESGASAAAMPIIAMTANAMSGSKEDCLECGMNDYITKPIDPEELEEKLAYWLQFASQINHQSNLHQAPRADTNPTDSAPADMQNNEPKKWQAEPVWDLDSALKRVRYKHERLVTLVNMFLEHTPDRLKKLLTLADDESWVDMAKIAHEVKGVAGNISAQRLYWISAELESECNKQNQRVVKVLLPLLIPSLEEVQILMQDYLQKNISHVSRL